MRKVQFLAYAGAIALLSITLGACSSNDDVAEINPTYDGTSVRTDFAFNISRAPQTRMSSDNTQAAGTNFRGMSHMYLFPFDGVPGEVSTINTEKPFALGELATSEISASNSKKIYSLMLPVGTDNFLFYGTATRGNETGFTVGRLSSSFFDADGTKKAEADNINSTENINFSLVPIASSLGDHNKIAAYLTAIANTTGWAGTVNIVTNNTVSNSGAYKALADLYTNFTKNSSDRCGSGEAVERTILDLFKTARLINAQSSVTEVQTIANAICTSIDTYIDEVRVTVGASNENPDNWTATLTGVDRTFPTNLGLPMGAAHLTFDETNKKFVYSGEVAPGPNHTPGTLYTHFFYPAELVYFDNSPLYATDAYKTADDFPSTPATWDVTSAGSSANGFTDDWTDTEVKASSRAVAMANNVNYGVALLQTTVKLAQDALTDNMKAILGGAATDQTDINGTEMKVTGLLIGGQPNQVDWNMVDPDNGFAEVIYDNDITIKETALSTGQSAANYTVVLDNYTSDSNGQKNVNFALQITNGDKDFYGKSGMIPAGHTFYLVGTMTLPTDLSTQSWAKSARDNNKWRWETGYRVTNENTWRVFMQDYVTKANITITKEALQNAYSSIPDLRSMEVVFGLSVDLKWEPGLTFNVNL